MDRSKKGGLGEQNRLLLVSWDLVTQVQATETASPEMGLWLCILSYLDSALVGASYTVALFCGKKKEQLHGVKMHRG